MPRRPTLPDRALNDRYVGYDDFVPLFADLFDTRLYAHPAIGNERDRQHASYSADATLWSDILNRSIHHGIGIELRSFWVTEWLPMSPGRYFTEAAARSREFAQEYWQPADSEYLPLGKNYMVLGGMGCIRLRARNIDGARRYVLGASSMGVAHQGVPLLLTDQQYDSVIDPIRTTGGAQCTIRGSLQALPTELAIVTYDRDIPRYAIAVDELSVEKAANHVVLQASVAVMLPSIYIIWSRDEVAYIDGTEHTGLKKSWAYATFRPDGHDRGLDEAVKWIEGYAVRRYIDGQPAHILADFDELVSHFDRPIEFPLRSISDGTIDIKRLQAYAAYYNLTIQVENLVMGDVFKNISNSSIVNRSKLDNSLNRLRSNGTNDLADALLAIAQMVEKSGNREAGELFAALNDEMSKPAPTPSLLRSLWNGLVTTLPSVASLSEAVAKITATLT